MAEFILKHLDIFLGVVRKYMQIRGALSQKELAVLAEVGVSTMSRFLTQKTTTIPFETDNAHKNSQESLKEKLENLSPRQTAYLTDF